MNYLAHFHLAGEDPGHIAGALLGDYVKGPLKGELPAGIEQGIVLHRRIDKFTDTALNNSALHAHFDPELRRYLGIVCDLYFDHLLASSWHEHDSRELAEYNQFVVQQLQHQQQYLPQAAQQFVQRLHQHEVLTLYKEQEMMARIFERTGNRVKRNNPIANSWEQLQQQHTVLLAFFEEFYPQLKHFAGEIRAGFDQP